MKKAGLLSILSVVVLLAVAVIAEAQQSKVYRVGVLRAKHGDEIWGYVKMKAKTKGLQTEKSATLGVSSGWSATQNLFSLGAFGHNYPFKGRFYHGGVKRDTPVYRGLSHGRSFAHFYGLNCQIDNCLTVESASCVIVSCSFAIIP
jgi:hypothetical protein